MRLVTWNIHGAFGLDGARDLARIAAVLRELRCDVAALQEVGDPRNRAGYIPGIGRNSCSSIVAPGIMRCGWDWVARRW